MKQRVLLGLSGGVDSAVAAYVLKEQGYDVTCAFMRNWDSFANQDILGNPTIQDDICPQEQDYLDACAVAEKLGLELLRIDFVKEYWDYVFTVFLEEYKKGRTPNPDILCNKYIKFDVFMKYAASLGFSYVATGHYAQVHIRDGVAHLYRGLDDAKDQTYFLCQIAQDSLRHSIFPIGHLRKCEVRHIAAQQGFDSVSTKRDSTGICFIGERNFRSFLQNYLPCQAGDIVDIDTQHVIGKHVGVLYYTIGQRKGLGIGGNKGPWYVVGKSVASNILYVANGNESEWLYSDACMVSGINWFSGIYPSNDMECTAKFRYRQADHAIIIRFLDREHAFLRYKSGISSVTSGQEAVFYQQEECLGGGVIEDVFYKGASLTNRLYKSVHAHKA